MDRCDWRFFLFSSFESAFCGSKFKWCLQNALKCILPERLLTLEHQLRVVNLSSLSVINPY